MDIQETTNLNDNQSLGRSVPVQSCPECAAAVLSGDRFCQECGARISQKLKRTVRERQIPTGPASVICINCGTTNQPLSTVCSDCKIQLVPVARNQVDASNGETAGLRGSLKTRVRNNASAKTPQPTATEPERSVSQETAPTVSNQPASAETPATTEKEEPQDGHAALDFLFPGSANGALGTRNCIMNSFDRLLAETRTVGGALSLSSFIVAIECFFEKVPTPLLFLLMSLLTITVTASVTTNWNRYEQRLHAIDKIAANAEENMRAFQLDDAIHTLRELEQTEKGDLPPRARAVLNQSLWLRSYYYAKQHKYAKAIGDLSGVTSDFVSYEDAVNKQNEYKKLLASHPEFAGSPVEEKSNKKKKKQEIAPAAEVKTKVKPISPLKKLNDPNEAQALLKQMQSVSQRVQSETVSSNNKKAQERQLAKTEKRKSEKSQQDLLDRDMKRYSGLLVEYFSKAELSRSAGEKVEEPPSYEEWIERGKPSF